MKRTILMTILIIVIGVIMTMGFDNRIIERDFSINAPHNGDEEFGLVINDIVQRVPSPFSDDESGPDGYKMKLEEAGYNFTEDDALLLGRTDTARDAARKAEGIWVTLYGEDVKWDNKPYIVWHDSKNEIWFVEGSFRGRWIHKIMDTFTMWFGGVPRIIIQKGDGKVLGVWHTK